jgi:hypothetical protein
MFVLKPLSKSAVPAALAKAERYRLLNEPSEAESICLDILDVDPQNQQALVMLLLALTDQFNPERPDAPRLAQDVLSRLHSEYDQSYYAGIISERRAKALIDHHDRGGRLAAPDYLRQALKNYEHAEAIRPADNDDAILRWNACVRVLNRYPELTPEERPEPLMLE